jgi:hypothetical protein
MVAQMTYKHAQARITMRHEYALFSAMQGGTFGLTAGAAGLMAGARHGAWLAGQTAGAAAPRLLTGGFPDTDAACYARPFLPA